MKRLAIGAAIILTAAAPAPGEARYDGTYAGLWRITMSDHMAECDRVDGTTLHLVVHDHRFRLWWRGAWAEATVAEDGGIEGHKVYQNHKTMPALLSIKGKIEDAHLIADIGTERCAFHIDLKKS